MKRINQYITEKLKITKNKKVKYTLFPKDTDELDEMIEKEMERNGYECSLNHIDVSQIKDMSELFYKSDFNGDISAWDVSKVFDMASMFYHSKFNQDISKWNTSKVINMSSMFNGSIFNKPIGNWDVSNVRSMTRMFHNSRFNKNISNWNISSKCYYYQIFTDADIKNEYKPAMFKH